MRKGITTDEIKRIAKLAHIKVDDKEVVMYAKQIGEILSYVEGLDKVNTDGIEFKSQTELKNVFREDVVGKSLDSKVALRNRKGKEKGGSLVISSVL